MLEKKLWKLFINYLCKLISFANDSTELADSKSFTPSNSKRKEKVTFSAEDNTFIWSFGDSLLQQIM